MASAAGLDRVVIIGGGASGVLMAAHLLRKSPDIRVTIIERRERLGAGIAYGTGHVDHLLNVRAGNMSAFADEPEHFWRWISRGEATIRALCPDPQSFAPRRVYRRYLDDVLRESAGDPAAARLKVVQGEAADLHTHAGGVVVTMADGTSHDTGAAILATGNESVALPAGGRRLDGWSNDAVAALPKDAAIGIIGTGLTMTDQVLSLLNDGHRGPITAISRRGLTHQAHRPVPGGSIAREDVPIGAPLSMLCRWLRRQVELGIAQGVDWRVTVDALRPHTQAIWLDLPHDDKRRFLRHGRPWWDIHRHRMAPSARQVLDAAIAAGNLRILSARVSGFDDKADAIAVKLVRRGARVPEELRFDAVLECRGRASDIASTENPLLRRLLATGTARPDAMGIGIDVTPGSEVIGADGNPAGTLFGIGPVTAGIFWETVAIPDIRVQAAALADRLLLRAA